LIYLVVDLPQAAPASDWFRIGTRRAYLITASAHQMNYDRLDNEELLRLAPMRSTRVAMPIRWSC
jgi:hypothetical protein